MHRESLSYIKYWISIEDGFSNYSVMGPLKDFSAKSVAEAIIDLWINVFLVPAKILTYRGASFAAKVFQEVTHTFRLKVIGWRELIRSCMRSDDRFPEKKERFNHIHLKMVQQEKLAIDLETIKS